MKNQSVIDMKKTGENILRLRILNQLTVKDLQDAFGFATPQSIYKWQSGITVPSVDNLIILSEIFHVQINDILVVNDNIKNLTYKQTELPKISVLIPTYNVAPYIHRCIKSVLMQDYSNIEIILIDGGSTDDTCEQIKPYLLQYPNIYFEKMDHANLSQVRNSLVDASTGDYLFFLDADDFIAPTTLSTLYYTAVSYEANIVQCEMENTCENHVFEGTNLGTKVYERDQALLEYNRTVNGPRCTATAKLYERHIFDHVRFPEHVPTQECEYTAYRFIDQCNRFAIVRKKLYGYYHNNNSITKKKFSFEKYDILGALEDSIAFYEQKNMDSQVLRIRFRYLTKLRLLYESTLKYYPDSTDHLEYLLSEYRKTLPLVIHNLDLSEEIKENFITWGDIPMSTTSFGYWFYVNLNAFK